MTERAFNIFANPQTSFLREVLTHSKYKELRGLWNQVTNTFFFMDANEGLHYNMRDMAIKGDPEQYNTNQPWHHFYVKPDDWEGVYSPELKASLAEKYSRMYYKPERLKKAA